MGSLCYKADFALCFRQTVPLQCRGEIIVIQYNANPQTEDVAEQFKCVIDYATSLYLVMAVVFIFNNYQYYTGPKNIKNSDGIKFTSRCLVTRCVRISQKV